ncbi:DUF2604 domain-containing protein [Hyalangium rubrum]|jgi:hypothetical protein|uniref:DUF2604 domain-containing protein n=1 Tax=Hyalangium rubrum TaxID=3103134 RepID=A0ABU5H8S3_9BACT|nr:DUF2604 domain-containing protein [Hyalangium sp. s54d21]MDY7229893.1 DUF2604 domain-containing protein [Hyalangium sp. s54d21]
MSKEGKFIELIFVVNGEDTPVKFNIKEPLHAARNKALAESGNTGRPPHEWEVRTEAGVLLEASAKLESLGLQSGTRLFLSLGVGGGG